MYQKFFKDLNQYSQNAIKIVKKNLDLSELGFDHICYQTLSSKHYESVLKLLQEKIVIIKEIPHSGRRIAVARLKDSFKVDGITIDKLEISEPKPKRTVKKAHFDHFALYVKGDFKSYIEELKSKKIKIFEEKQIGEDKLVKFKDDGVEIEIRNNKLAEEGHEGAVEKSTSKRNTNDVSALQQELDEEKEKKLRALADYQNLLKRINEEREDIKVLANADILSELLDILEDMDRAIQNIKLDEAEQVGIRLVRDKIRKVIDSNGLEEIKIGEGDMLDANNCEAVGVVAVTEEVQDNMIKQVVQKGYKLKGSNKLVRPVKVIVGKKGRN